MRCSSTRRHRFLKPELADTPPAMTPYAHSRSTAADRLGDQHLGNCCLHRRADIRKKILGNGLGKVFGGNTTDVPGAR